MYVCVCVKVKYRSRVVVVWFSGDVYPVSKIYNVVISSSLCSFVLKLMASNINILNTYSNVCVYVCVCIFATNI